ncbi:MAG: hypothetical protein QOF19_3211 [Alphaproteobacteria bacterium]|jgi:hypothetical protein|nr:hypothetical protein [Alphaproteobacteria bacterium]
MCGLLRHCAAGLAVLLALSYATPSGMGLKFFGQSTAQGVTTSAVDRAHKGDRMPVAAARERDRDRVISAVEVVGLRDAAVIYRDRDDQVLFRTDPLANATVVARGVVLPQVTIRDVPRAPAAATASSAVEIKPVSPSAAPAVKIDREKKIPEGCDSAFSPLAESARANNFTTRCLAAITPPTRFAGAIPRG